VVSNSDGFYLRAVVNPNYSTVTHRSDSLYTDPNTGKQGNSFTYDVPCTVPDGTQANAPGADPTKFDINCIVEMEELDMYFNGITLQYNVPSDMCTYFRYQTPYFFKFAPGYGPPTAKSSVDANGNITDIANTIDGVPYCPFDYSSSSGGGTTGPNCCFGTYTLVQVTTSGTTFSPNTPWGGSYADCLDGPAMDTQTKTTLGFPEPSLAYVSGSGVNSTYVVASPISKTYSGNVFTANYFDHTGATPNAFNPANGNTPPTAGVLGPYTGFQIPVQTESYFNFECLDRDDEIQARIRLSIRSWDKAGLSNILGTQPGGPPSSYGPTTGTAPYFYPDPYHDYSIWYDFPNTPSSNYQAGYPGFNE
jgi:hypothetical protein